MRISLFKNIFSVLFYPILAIILFGLFFPASLSAMTESKLIANNAGSGDAFGSAVSVYGDIALLGAPMEDAPTNSGAAYIYRYDGVNWIEETKLTASDGGGSDAFGSAVSMSGNAVLVGARNDTNGSAYIFGSTWREESILRASDGAAIDYFGNTVSLYNDKALIGATYDDDLGPSSASAYLFQYDGTTWLETSKLKASDGMAWDKWGISVSIYESTMLVGAHFHSDGVIQAGAATSSSALSFLAAA